MGQVSRPPTRSMPSQKPPPPRDLKKKTKNPNLPLSSHQEDPLQLRMVTVANYYYCYRLQEYILCLRSSELWPKHDLISPRNRAGMRTALQRRPQRSAEVCTLGRATHREEERMEVGLLLGLLVCRLSLLISSVVTELVGWVLDNRAD